MGEQSRYRVRFDWGLIGALAIAGDADVLVWVDALDPEPPPLDALPAGCAVVSTGLDGAAESAAWVLALQEAIGVQPDVAVVAAGGDRAGSPRFSAEDLLAAGAVMDELAARGIDVQSPEATVADAAYRFLRPRVRTMLPRVVAAGRPAGGLRVHRPHPGVLEAAADLVG
jgi:hypothetical protein